MAFFDFVEMNWFSGICENIDLGENFFIMYFGVN